MDKQIVFEDEHIRAIFMPGSSSELIFSFGDLITRAKGLNINAEKSLQKFEFNVLGIMPKHKSWFPQGSMWNMLKAVAELIAPFQQRVAYGGSMGGYAAIKYSRALGVQRVVAMVPQYSINPDDVHDARYNMFYQPELNAGMRVEADDIDITCEYIIVYDQYCAEDRAHYLKLQALIPQHHVLHLPLPDMMPLPFWPVPNCCMTFWYMITNRVIFTRKCVGSRKTASSIIAKSLKMSCHAIVWP